MRQRSLFLLALSIWCVLATFTGIWVMRPRPDASDDIDRPPPTPTPSPSLSAAPSPAPSRHARSPSPTKSAAAATRPCRRTQGASARLTTDDRGYTCAVGAVDPDTNCCTEWGPRYSCTGCTPTCCADYAQCTACCMGHERPFARCMTMCRTGSHSLDGNAGYATPETPYCWGPPPPPPKPTVPATKILDLRE